MVIAPTIGWRFPAKEHPRPIWDGIRIQLLQLTLIGESNVPGKSCLVKNAELTPPLQKKSQPCSLSRRRKRFLTPPVEKRSQLTLSAQWSLEKPLDGGLESPRTASPWLLVGCCADVTEVVSI